MTMTDEEIKTAICSLFYNLCTIESFCTLELLLNEFKTQKIDKDPQRCYMFVLTVKIIIYCRDIIYGKGERQQSYSLLYCLYQYYPETAWYIIRRLPLCILHNEKTISTGCWRDIPELCKYVRRYSQHYDEDTLIDRLVHYMNEQLAEDYQQLHLYAMDITHPLKLSLAAKWIPRERSKTAWLYTKFAMDWFTTNDPYKLTSAKTITKWLKAVNKCKKDYRRAVSLLNSRLDIVETYQCSHQWLRIDPQTMNLHSLKKYHRAFFSFATINEMNTPDLDRSADISIQCDITDESLPLTDRNACYKRFHEHYTKYISDAKPSNNLNDRSAYKKSTTDSLYEKNVPFTCKQNTLSIETFVRRALSLIRQRIDINKVMNGVTDEVLILRKKKTLEMQINVLNNSWDEFTADIEANECIPILCMDYSLQFGHLGLACLYAKKTQRVLIIKNGNNLLRENFITRITVDISKLPTFVEIIECLHQHCDMSINNIIDVNADLDQLFYHMCISGALHHNTKFVFISNINILADIKRSIETYASKIYRKGSIVFHYLGCEAVSLKTDEQAISKELLIVNSYNKSTVKHITNYTFPDNFNMLSHCLNLYSAAFLFTETV